MAQTKGIKIRFEADASPVKSALAQVEKSSKNLTKQLKDIDKLLEMDPTNVTLLAQKQDILQKSIKATEKNLQAMEKAQQEVTDGYQKWQQNQQAIEKNNAAIEKMQAELEAAKNEMEMLWPAVGEGKATEEEFAAVSAKADVLTKKLAELQNAQQTLSQNLSQNDVLPEDAYQRYITDTERLRVNLQSLSSQQEQVNEAISHADTATADAVDHSQ